MSYSLWPHGLQHDKLPCPSPTPRTCSNSYSLSWWCHPTISFCHPLLSCLKSFPASGSFQMSQFFASGGQSIGASVLASVLPMNTEDWFSLGLTGLISLLSKGLSRVFSNTTVQKHQFFSPLLSLQSNYLIHTWLLEKIALTTWNFVRKVMSLLFPRSKCLLISWLQSSSAVILEPKKTKSVTVSIVSPSICHEAMGPDAMILVFWLLSFKPVFSFPLPLSSRGSLVPLGFLP